MNAFRWIRKQWRIHVRRRVYVTDFGADPTAATDSADAVRAAIQVAARASRPA